MLEQIINWLAGFRDEEGATAVEYGVMVALIAAVVIAGASALGSATNNCLADTAQTIAASTPDADACQ